MNGANGGKSDCDYCRKADSVILFCTCAYFGRDCNVQPLKDRIQDPWYPLDPYTLEASGVPDRSQRLREIDLSRIFINGRIIKATVIIPSKDSGIGKFTRQTYIAHNENLFKLLQQASEEDVSWATEGDRLATDGNSYSRQICGRPGDGLSVLEYWYFRHEQTSGAHGNPSPCSRAYVPPSRRCHRRRRGQPGARPRAMAEATRFAARRTAF